MPFTAVLFDMDGVIVDTEPLHKKAFHKMFDEYGIVVPDTLYASFAGASTKRVCLTLIEHFGLSQTYEELQDAKRRYFKDLFYNDTEFDLMPGVRSLIEHYYSNGIKLVLASSAAPVTIGMVFDKFNLHSFFIGRISGTELKESKPNPEIFLRAAQIAGEPSQNCMVIEDSTNGIKAAKAAGIFCAGYKSPHTKGQDYSLADIAVTDFAALEIDKIAKYF